MSSSMSILHRIIAVLIAAWIPFCCCTLRGAAAVVQTGETPIVGSCCGNTSRGLCEDDRDSGQEQENDGHCTTCCIKVAPEPPTEWAPELELGTIPAFEGVIQVVPTPENPFRSGMLRARAPDPPPSWTLLEQHALLLV